MDILDPIDYGSIKQISEGTGLDERKARYEVDKLYGKNLVDRQKFPPENEGGGNRIWKYRLKQREEKTHVSRPNEDELNEAQWDRDLD